ncbi:hypothetical protein BC941DRAFT_495544 [Chlamydoabsidia padenii]|nr:hypothetical protein BC941DRAFT_495544 [Chlamydoabsidia padenii]
MEPKIFERQPGQAPIKNEFRKERWFDDEETGEPERFGVFGDDDAAEGEKFNKGDKKTRNERGANKGPRGKKRIEEGIKICSSTALGEPCGFGENCRFSHELEQYLKEKPADLGDRCVQFELFGKCQRGYKCRYLNAHLDENKKLVVNEELVKKNPVYTKNGISAESQKALSKRKYQFPRSTAYMKEVEAEQKELNEQKEENRKRKLAENSEQNDTQSATAFKKEKLEDGTVKVVEEDSEKPKPVGPIDTQYKKLIDFSDKTYLAPLTTVGNLPFRRICKGYGVDITCGEMAMATNLLQGQQSEWALTKRHVSEDIFGIQICGSKVENVVKACEALNNEVDVDFVDLNMGCPIDLVFKNGGGSALIESRGKMTKMLRGMQRVLDVPVTVKFRMGIKEGVPVADKLIPRFEDLNIPLGTIHGRSRTQRYTKLADWDYISQLKKHTSTMKLFGNGDVLSFEDYNRHKQEAGIDGVMIGRGALIKPWIFDEIRNQRHWDISSRERFDMMKSFCDFGLEHWGSDSQGVNTTRRFLCEWQSFLYRYIPIGLLEVYPQKINERAPPYMGRDELETLMASPKADDWVKLTERLLGPAPEDFQFIPKHKANSFQG